MAIQPRDLALLADVFESRFTTVRHAAALHFDGRFEMARKRLAKLSRAGLLHRQAVRIAGGAVIFAFARPALDVLVRYGFLPAGSEASWTATLRKRFSGLSPLTLAHEVGLLDLKAALSNAVQTQAHLRLIDFGVWPAPHTFAVSVRSRRVTVRPDGFIHLRSHSATAEPEDLRFYLEYDRGTETLRRIEAKVAGYLAHRRAKAFGRAFRVLFVIDTREAHRRRENLTQALAAMGVRRFALIATREAFLQSPLASMALGPAATTGGDATDPESQRVAAVSSHAN